MSKVDVPENHMYVNPQKASLSIRELIFTAIDKERTRQDAKWGWPNAGLAGKDLYKKLTILGEEFGEVANAILEDDISNMRTELIQVAAVCVAWLESEIQTGSNL